MASLQGHVPAGGGEDALEWLAISTPSRAWRLSRGAGVCPTSHPGICGALSGLDVGRCLDHNITSRLMSLDEDLYLFQFCGVMGEVTPPLPQWSLCTWAPSV